MPEKSENKILTYFTKFATILYAGSLIYLIYLLKDRVFSLPQNFFEYLLFSYFILVSVYIFFRFTLTLVYNLKKHKYYYNTEEYQPSISFVIPVYNEELDIQNTIERCFKSNYPSEKLEVVVVNDGSTDNTGKILDSLKNKYKNLVIVHQENQGKRHAGYNAIKTAKGEIIIHLDSDSSINPEDIDKMVKPFANSNIGAVCGNATPSNSDENWVTKMQSLYYYFSFNTMKAAESSTNSILCCSGCGSAYRRDILLDVIDEWRDEMFLGKQVTWGDDRSLTGRVLREGYDTIFLDNVRVETIVPNKFTILIKQQARWKKSWVVNSIFLFRFIFKKRLVSSFLNFIPAIVISLVSPLLAFYWVYYTFFTQGMAGSGKVGYYLLGVLSVFALYLTFYFWNNKFKNFYFIFTWAIINVLFFIFIMYFSIITIQNRKWGTG